MNTMIIFYVIILLLGIYMAVAARSMKKSGEIHSILIAESEAASCKDKKGFIDYMYWREVVFGIACCIVGILGVVDGFMIPLGKIVRLAGMILFLAAAIWFWCQLGAARKTFFE